MVSTRSLLENEGREGPAPEGLGSKERPICPAGRTSPLDLRCRSLSDCQAKRTR